jgi:hypothetical protein
MFCAEEMLPTRPFPIDEDLKAQEILIEMIRGQDSAHDAETGARNRLDVLGGYRLRLFSLAVVILVLDSVGIVDFDLDLQITQTRHPIAARKAEGKEAEMVKSATHSSMFSAVTVFGFHGNSLPKLDFVLKECGSVDRKVNHLHDAAN